MGSPQKEVSNLGNNINRAASTALNDVNKNVAKAGNDVNNTLDQGAKNLEASGQRILMGVGELSKGNLNNAGNTLLEVATFGLTGGMSSLAGYKAGETPTERRMREMSEKAARESADQAVRDAQAAKDKAQNDVNAIVDELTNSRKKQPGRAATLLTTYGAGDSYGTLLNPVKGA